MTYFSSLADFAAGLITGWFSALRNELAFAAVWGWANRRWKR